MSVLPALGELGSKFNQDGTRVLHLHERFPFIPKGALESLPAGWARLFFRAVMRLSSVVPKAQWNGPFRVAFADIEDGTLRIELDHGPLAAKAICRKVRRGSAHVCVGCGSVAIMFRDRDGNRPLCPECVAGPTLLRDLEEVLWWKGGLADEAGHLIPARVPPSLIRSFNEWCANERRSTPIAPWELHPWLSELDRVYKRNPGNFLTHT
jgi:hypothetical protein